MAALWEMIADGSLGAAYLRTLEPLLIGLVISLGVGVGGGRRRWASGATSSG